MPAYPERALPALRLWAARLSGSEYACSQPSARIRVHCCPQRTPRVRDLGGDSTNASARAASLSSSGRFERSCGSLRTARRSLPDLSRQLLLDGHCVRASLLACVSQGMHFDVVSVVGLVPDVPCDRPSKVADARACVRALHAWFFGGRGGGGGDGPTLDTCA
eukprot:Amastigsp_a75_434.p2 type:complete len:163 gc:universal Amastigsp_a75_434:511-23(-)